MRTVRRPADQDQLMDWLAVGIIGFFVVLMFTIE
jgi:hypothetical protein